MNLVIDDPTPSDEEMAERLGVSLWDVEQEAWEERDWYRQEAEFERRMDV